MATDFPQSSPIATEASSDNSEPRLTQQMRNFLYQSSLFANCALLRTAFLACFCLLILSACSSTLAPSATSQEASQEAPAEFGSPNSAPANSTSAQAIGQSQLIQAQADGAKKVELIFSARVKKILPDDTKGLPHQRLLLSIDNGTTVLLAHDIKYAPRVPVQVGDLLVVKGEYIWNRKGGVVHWTHHSDTPRHEGGYIEFNGQRYE